jgi:hypothetical protein
MQRKNPKATTEVNAKARAGKGNGENECKGKDTGNPRVAARPRALARAWELGSRFHFKKGAQPVRHNMFMMHIMLMDGKVKFPESNKVILP